MIRKLSKLWWKLTGPKPPSEIRYLQEQRRIARQCHKQVKHIDKRIQAITHVQLRNSISRIGDAP